MELKDSLDEQKIAFKIGDKKSGEEPNVLNAINLLLELA